MGTPTFKSSKRSDRIKIMDQKARYGGIIFGQNLSKVTIKIVERVERAASSRWTKFQNRNPIKKGQTAFTKSQKSAVFFPSVFGDFFLHQFLVLMVLVSCGR